MRTWLRSKLLWVLVLAIGAGIYFFARPKPALTDTRVGVVRREDLVQRVTIAGVINAHRMSLISAPYNGYVKKLFVHVGDHVKIDDPIVSVAQSLRGGNEDLYPLRAPFAGTVTQVLADEGQYVEQGATNGTIVRIDDMSSFHVEASSPEIDVAKLKIGQDALIKASAILNRSYHGKINKIFLAAKSQQNWSQSRVEYTVKISITDPDEQLRPGMSVVVDVITRKAKHVLTLSHEFIEKKGDQYFVTTVEGKKVPIQVGLENEEAFEIRKGLTEGEKIRQVDYLSGSDNSTGSF